MYAVLNAITCRQKEIKKVDKKRQRCRETEKKVRHAGKLASLSCMLPQGGWQGPSGLPR